MCKEIVKKNREMRHRESDGKYTIYFMRRERERGEFYVVYLYRYLSLKLLLPILIDLFIYLLFIYNLLNAEYV